jgi:hypothetical protein
LKCDRLLFFQYGLYIPAGAKHPQNLNICRFDRINDDVGAYGKAAAVGTEIGFAASSYIGELSDFWKNPCDLRDYARSSGRIAAFFSDVILNLVEIGNSSQ